MTEGSRATKSLASRSATAWSGRANSSKRTPEAGQQQAFAIGGYRVPRRVPVGSMELADGVV